MIISAVTFGILLISHYGWVQISSAKVTQNGESLDNGKVYRSSNGDILISFGINENHSSYIFYPERSLIGIPNGNQFAYLPMFAFSKDELPPVVLSTNRVKIEHDMNIIVGNNSVEFTISNGARVQVSY